MNHRLLPKGLGTTMKEKRGLTLLPKQFKNLEDPDKFLNNPDHELVFPFQPSLIKKESVHFQSLRNSLAHSSSIDMKSLASLNSTPRNLNTIIFTSNQSPDGSSEYH